MMQHLVPSHGKIYVLFFGTRVDSYHTHSCIWDLEKDLSLIIISLQQVHTQHEPPLQLPVKNHISHIILNVKNAFRRLTEIQCEIIIVMQCLQKNQIC